MIQCMGGFCTSRETCKNYSAPPSKHQAPVERLCGSAELPNATQRTWTFYRHAIEKLSKRWLDWKTT